MTETSVLPEAIEPLKAITRVPEGGSERRGFVFLDRNERPSPLPGGSPEPPEPPEPPQVRPIKAGSGCPPGFRNLRNLTSR